MVVQYTMLTGTVVVQYTMFKQKELSCAGCPILPRSFSRVWPLWGHTHCMVVQRWSNFVAEMILWLTSTTKCLLILDNNIIAYIYMYCNHINMCPFILLLNRLLLCVCRMHLPSIGFMKPSWMRVAIAPAPPEGKRRGGGKEGEKERW